MARAGNSNTPLHASVRFLCRASDRQNTRETITNTNTNTYECACTVAHTHTHASQRPSRVGAHQGWVGLRSVVNTYMWGGYSSFREIIVFWRGSSVLDVDTKSSSSDVCTSRLGWVTFRPQYVHVHRGGVLVSGRHLFFLLLTRHTYTTCVRCFLHFF